ncbi:leucine-rich repeat-containing protein 43 [Ctenodactylus gundi]
MEASSDSEGERAPETVSEAVGAHLRRLCLREFPCGTGSWNKSRFLPQTWKTWRELVPGAEAAVSPEEETVEALLSLVRSPQSPWALPKNSSAEDRFLRELAIQSPLMIRDKFFYSYFRCLRVVNHQVSLVDKDLLKFLKLEELVLSANRIKEVDAVNLPPTLKVLELYGNEITSMECLCVQPPPGLQHLGLGQNKLRGPLESPYVTTSHWPNLVSLDLSFNDLTDLQGMVASLSTLRRLRLLVLQGNPLALVPYYRGLTIDSLPQLCVLDDVTVSPSEKHQFQGLCIHGDILAQEAHLVVTIGNIRGIMDTSVLDPEPGPEGPFVTYKYYVTYDFLEEEKGKAEEEGELNEAGEVVTEEEGVDKIAKPSQSLDVLEELHEAGFEETALGSQGSPAMVGTEQVESESSVISAPLPVLPSASDSAEQLVKLRPHIGPQLCASPGTVLFSTGHKPWENVTPCSYEMQHTFRDLVPLKAFLLAGTTVAVVEEKILSWPLPPPPTDSPLPAKKGKGEPDRKGKDRKAEDRKGTGKAEKPPKEERKKRDAPQELRRDPPVLQVLGSGPVALEPLLAGEPVVSEVCNFGVIRTVESDKLTFARDSKKTKKGVKKEKTKSVAPLFESDYQPEPLTVEVEIQLGQCRSAEEALQALGALERAQ